MALEFKPDIIWQGREINCIFPQYMKKHITFNPRQLPVIQRKKDEQSEQANKDDKRNSQRQVHVPNVRRSIP